MHDTEPTTPGTLATLRERLSAVDAALAAEVLADLETDADADAVLDRLDVAYEFVFDAFDAGDVDRLRGHAAGAFRGPVATLEYLRAQPGGLRPFHRDGIAAQLVAGQLLRQLEAANA